MIVSYSAETPCSPLIYSNSVFVCVRGDIDHAGVFLMLRSGLASRMHTRYTRKKSFFQLSKGSGLLDTPLT